MYFLSLGTNGLIKTFQRQLQLVVMVLSYFDILRAQLTPRSWSILCLDCKTWFRTFRIAGFVTWEHAGFTVQTLRREEESCSGLQTCSINDTTKLTLVTYRRFFSFFFFFHLEDIGTEIWTARQVEAVSGCILFRYSLYNNCIKRNSWNRNQ